VTDAANRLSVGLFTPLTGINLVELHEILVLAGVDISYNELQDTAKRAEVWSCEDVPTPFVTEPQLTEIAALLDGVTPHDERVQRVLADEFRMIRDYHRALHSPLMYDLPDSAVECEKTFHVFFSLVHAVTDLCCVVASEPFDFEVIAYGDALVRLWREIAAAYPCIGDATLFGHASAIDQRLNAHRSTLNQTALRPVRTVLRLLRNPRAFLHVLTGIHGEVEGLLRYADLILLGAHLREQRARLTGDRAMIMAHILRRNFLDKGLFY